MVYLKDLMKMGTLQKIMRQVIAGLLSVLPSGYLQVKYIGGSVQVFFSAIWGNILQQFLQVQQVFH